jgi:hypothetical protein
MASLAQKLAAWASLNVAMMAAMFALDSGLGPMDEAARFKERVSRGIAALAGASLYLLALLHGDKAKPFAIAGGSALVVSALTDTGLALSSTEREEAAVRWMSAILFGAVTCASAIAGMVGVIRAVQAFVHDWQDPSGERAETVMRQRERVESIMVFAVECLLSAAVIVACVAVVAFFRRPSLHVTRADMSGKVVVITDSCSGRGFLHAETLAHWNAEVIVTCDDEEKAKRSAARLAELSGNPHVHGMLLDLRSIQSIRLFAKAFAENHRHLHVLVNSADAPVSAATSGPDLLTEDGIDSVLQVRL